MTTAVIKKEVHAAADRTDKQIQIAISIHVGKYGPSGI